MSMHNDLQTTAKARLIMNLELVINEYVYAIFACHRSAFIS